MIHDLRGSAVAVASMTTPFVPSTGSDRVSQSNPGAWLILRPDPLGQPDTWHPCGRLEAWRKTESKDSICLRLHLLPDDYESGILVSDVLISADKGGEFFVDMDRQTSNGTSSGADNIADALGYKIGGFVMNCKVQGEKKKSSKLLVQLAMRHVASVEHAAIFMALAAAVDLSIEVSSEQVHESSSFPISSIVLMLEVVVTKRTNTICPIFHWMAGTLTGSSIMLAKNSQLGFFASPSLTISRKKIQVSALMNVRCSFSEQRTGPVKGVPPKAVAVDHRVVLQEEVPTKTKEMIREEQIEKIIYRFRLFTLLGVSGSLVGSVLCFLKGSVIIVSSFMQYLSHRATVVSMLIQATDVYLLGTVMLVFGMGLYELFISNLDVGKTSTSRSNFLGLFVLQERPKWLEIKSVDELKTKLGHVIVMVLLVGLFEKSHMVAITAPVDVLFFAASIMFSSCGLFLLSKLKH